MSMKTAMRTANDNGTSLKAAEMLRLTGCLFDHCSDAQTLTRRADMARAYDVIKERSRFIAGLRLGRRNAYAEEQQGKALAAASHCLATLAIQIGA